MVEVSRGVYVDRPNVVKVVCTTTNCILEDLLVVQKKPMRPRFCLEKEAEFRCLPCQCRLTSVSVLASHIMGKRHRAAMKNQTDEEEASMKMLRAARSPPVEQGWAEGRQREKEMRLENNPRRKSPRVKCEEYEYEEYVEPYPEKENPIAKKSTKSTEKRSKTKKKKSKNHSEDYDTEECNRLLKKLKKLKKKIKKCKKSPKEEKKYKKLHDAKLKKDNTEHTTKVEEENIKLESELSSKRVQLMSLLLEESKRSKQKASLNKTTPADPCVSKSEPETSAGGAFVGKTEHDDEQQVQQVPGVKLVAAESCGAKLQLKSGQESCAFEDVPSADNQWALAVARFRKTLWDFILQEFYNINSRLNKVKSEAWLRTLAYVATEKVTVGEVGRFADQNKDWHCLQLTASIKEKVRAYISRSYESLVMVEA